MNNEELNKELMERINHVSESLKNMGAVPELLRGFSSSRYFMQLDKKNRELIIDIVDRYYTLEKMAASLKYDVSNSKFSVDYFDRFVEDYSEYINIKREFDSDGELTDYISEYTRDLIINGQADKFKFFDKLPDVLKDLAKEYKKETKKTDDNKNTSSAQKTVLSIYDKLKQVYIEKNNDYGDSFNKSINRYGLISALTRMGDKFSRLETLITNKAEAKVGESLYDTLLDLANYAIMTAAYLEDRGLKDYK